MKKLMFGLFLFLGLALFANANGYCDEGSLYDYPVKLWRSSITAGGQTPTVFSATAPIVIHNIIQTSTMTTPSCGEMSILRSDRAAFDTTAATIAHRNFINPDTVETPFNVLSSSVTFIQGQRGCSKEITILWEWLSGYYMSHTPF